MHVNIYFRVLPQIFEWDFGLGLFLFRCPSTSKLLCLLKKSILMNRMISLVLGARKSANANIWNWSHVPLPTFSTTFRDFSAKTFYQQVRIFIKLITDQRTAIDAPLVHKSVTNLQGTEQIEEILSINGSFFQLRLQSRVFTTVSHIP